MELYANGATDIPGEFEICGERDATTDSKRWADYLTTALELDDASLDTIPPGTYMVRIGFIVDKNGRPDSVKVIKDTGYGLGERARKVVAAYSGRWMPASLSGRAVSSHHIQPVTFVVERPDEIKEEEEEKLFAEVPMP